MQCVLTRLIFLSILLLALHIHAEGQTEYKFTVQHDHLYKYCEGELIITQSGIEYRTDHKKHRRSWPYIDIKMIKIVSPTHLSVLTYENSRIKIGMDESFSLVLTKGKITADINQFISSHIKRPFSTTFTKSGDKPQYTVQVRHRHRFGGCVGVLKIYSDGMAYEAEKESKNSRYWGWKDIESIGRSGPFQIEVRTYEPQIGGPTRVFNFDLKQKLDDQVYDYVWDKVYQSLYRKSSKVIQFSFQSICLPTYYLAQL
jgi:hypothetical protein